MTKKMIEITILAALFCCLGMVAMRAAPQANSGNPSVAVEQARFGIEKAHNADVAATLARDPVALANLFADDGVLLAPGSKPAVGREAILAEIRKEKALSPEAKALSYNPHVQDTQIMDGRAVEWGYFEASVREAPAGEIKQIRGNMLRVLKRQPGGEWKFARVMWSPA
jgi:uncharacterized protein (TIGR02246 family)